MSGSSHRPDRGTPQGSAQGCDLEVEPARACYPYAPPAVFTGTGALYDRPTSALSPDIPARHVMLAP